MTKRFKLWRTVDRDGNTDDWGVIDTDKDDIDYEEYVYDEEEVVELLNNLIGERDYWKKNAMTLLMQVRSLTPRMTDEEVRRFNQELGG